MPKGVKVLDVFDRLNPDTDTVKKKRDNSEDRLQAACCKWFNMQFQGTVMFHPANGGFRNAFEAAKFKRMNVIPGVADLVILTPRAGYAAMFVELKSEKGKQSLNQKIFEEYCKINGYKYQVVRSFDEFKEKVSLYMKSSPTYHMAHYSNECKY